MIIVGLCLTSVGPCTLLPFNQGFLAWQYGVQLRFSCHVSCRQVGDGSGVPGRGSGARARRRRGTSGLGCLPPHNPHLELGVATRRSPAGVVFFAQLNVFMQNGCVKCYINCIKLDKVTCNSGATVGRPTHNHEVEGSNPPVAVNLASDWLFREISGQYCQPQN